MLDGTRQNEAYDADISVKLQENMESASRIIDFVETKFFYIPNHPQRLELTQNITQNDRSHVNFLLRTEIRNTQDPLNKAKEHHIGNCGELSDAGIEYARTQEILSVERFQIDRGDHVFLVIGRAVDSNPSEYNTWGADAVICDPWAGTFFPASRIEQFLLDFIGIVQQENKIYAQVTSFNPQKQTLQSTIVPSDIYTRSGQY